MGQALAGKSAVITGSTSGIGLGIARAFAAEGANVMLNGLGEAAAIEATRSGLEKESGVKVRYHGADMMKPAEIADLIRAAEKEFGAVDILVNNAGIQHVSPVDEFPIEKWDAIIAINLSSAFHATRAALPGMKKRGWGRVINVASIHGLVASPYKSAYVAAKHGVVGFTKTVALEVAELGITVNAICPGYVWTPIVEKQLEDQVRVHAIPKEKVIADIMLAPQPTKKFIKIEEVARVALNLADESAAQVNGTAMVIDGGWTAR
ncbi:MAG: 3-hydroxybutyrate dehydrogenase [Betaproteobacteria bacterium]|nr:3-hydroxybutyrate dehydrogenase [Betaproteobacteria bacterium]